MRISLIFLLSLIVSCSTIKTQIYYGVENANVISSLIKHAEDKKCGKSSKLCVIDNLSFSIRDNIVIKLGEEKVIVFVSNKILQHNDFSEGALMYWKHNAVENKAQKNNKVISDFFIKVENYYKIKKLDIL
ncbi:hypothetical protein A9Q91_04240 [Candidatus Gracilibacteria bacterium 28_42_T64]|nr:hypothetical protein A9Q91_04240 [Candidatus Gracilibacteria bacterium 28_42_T64]